MASSFSKMVSRNEGISFTSIVVAASARKMKVDSRSWLVFSGARLSMESRGSKSFAGTVSPNVSWLVG